MKKFSFKNDYSEGAHPKILEILSNTNFAQEAGYGEDNICSGAIEKIKNVLGNFEVDIHFIAGGTQANLTCLATMLRPFESVIAVESAHIAVHEAGAIEATGHKINTVKSLDGKLKVADIQQVFDEHYFEHMVKPMAVYISHSTEVGTIYKRAEIEEISKLCREKGLYLYLDGARLGQGLCSKESDFSIADLVNWVDAFYIGGTKNGALLGEAIVIVNDKLKENFRYSLKQRGALMAKGRVLGAQFLGLFTDNLYFDLAKNANAMAAKLTSGMKEQGYEFLTESSTNQIFPILPNEIIEKLQEFYDFYVWAKVDETKSAIRLVTSWATKEENVNEFLMDLNKIRENH
ncbi:aminotransferase class V-fold PLP-dependent enzyme [Candidatus Dojkabacteria bacterium]|nr:aminotransferase class V-fold PLP-dependent enzyme [Candidatus Dojkabacteria bacterium]